MWKKTEKGSIVERIREAGIQPGNLPEAQGELPRKAWNSKICAVFADASTKSSSDVTFFAPAESCGQRLIMWTP